MLLFSQKTVMETQQVNLKWLARAQGVLRLPAQLPHSWKRLKYLRQRRRTADYNQQEAVTHPESCSALLITALAGQSGNAVRKACATICSQEEPWSQFNGTQLVFSEQVSLVGAQLSRSWLDLCSYSYWFPATIAAFVQVCNKLSLSLFYLHWSSLMQLFKC